MSCLDCEDKPAHNTGHAARGLCATCYHRNMRNGTLDRFPRRLRRSEDTAEEYEFLKGCGLSMSEIAARIGINERSVYRALSRVRSLAAGGAGTAGGS